MTTKAMQTRLDETRQMAHPNCVVCGSANEHRRRIDFVVLPDGSVEGHFRYGRFFEGYEACLHGGVIASLLDGAMTNCLFAHGHTALTAELNVRYRHPVLTNRKVTIRARIEKSVSSLHLLEAQVLQEGRVMATATAKFMDSPLLPDQGQPAHAEVHTHHDAC